MTGEFELESSYQMCDEIGRGRFGTITRCFSPATKELYACKTIDKRVLVDALDRECITTEPRIMAMLPPHPNVVRIHELFETEHTLAIVMELVDPPTTIYDRLISVAGGRLSEPEAATYARKLLRAVAHCHRRGVVHRDVKPENVLIDERGGVKLCDFGSAVWLGGEKTETAEGVVGTPYYLAPEVVMGRRYGEKVDVWSVGVVIYTMLAGEPPFKGETAEEIFEAILRGNLRFPPKKFKSVSVEAKDLLRKMICRDVSRRFSADVALRKWICISGVLYYPAAANGSSLSSMVACFDLSTEKYSFVNLMETLTEAMHESKVVVNYNGKLGLLMLRDFREVSRESTSFELWVLQDAGKHEWSKHVYALPVSWKDVVTEGMSIVGMVGTNEIVLSPLFPKVPSYLIYYNVESKRITKVGVKGMEAIQGKYVFTYLNYVENVKLL